MLRPRSQFPSNLHRSNNRSQLNRSIRNLPHNSTNIIRNKSRSKSPFKSVVRQEKSLVLHLLNQPKSCSELKLLPLSHLVLLNLPRYCKILKDIPLNSRDQLQLSNIPVTSLALPALAMSSPIRNSLLLSQRTSEMLS